MKKIFTRINWNKSAGLVPAVIQDEKTGSVLMLGYMNEAALKKTLATKKVWFYSRSKRRLWIKGETSGNILSFISARIDCDGDTLLVTARPKGPTCHTGKGSCFDLKDERDISLENLFKIIEERKRTRPKNSYTAFLFQKGLSKICAKISEESDEVVRAAKKETRTRLIEESVDVIYHLFVLLVAKKVKFAQLMGEIRRRNK